jgi:hypothetical protein
MTELLPILRQVVVPGTPAAAFEVFTIEIGLWWPLADHSVYGEGGSVDFQDRPPGGAGTGRRRGRLGHGSELGTRAARAPVSRPGRRR